jgi:hypothetical protein
MFLLRQAGEGRRLLGLLRVWVLVLTPHFFGTPVANAEQVNTRLPKQRDNDVLLRPTGITWSGKSASSLCSSVWLEKNCLVAHTQRRVPSDDDECSRR